MRFSVTRVTEIRGPDSNRDYEVQSLGSCRLDHPGGRPMLCFARIGAVDEEGFEPSTFHV